MKKTYTLADGGVIIAADAHEFGASLRSGSLFDSEGSNSEYMLRFAERYKVQTGIRLDAGSEDAFFGDLKKSGYIVHQT